MKTYNHYFEIDKSYNPVFNEGSREDDNELWNRTYPHRTLIDLIKILKDLQDDKSSFEKLGITYEEKAFYDILVKVRDDHGFPYEEEKCLILAKKIKELVDDKAQFADWATRDDIKNQLNMDLTVLLYKNGYPPEWDEEVFEKVMEQAENFKKHADVSSDTPSETKATIYQMSAANNSHMMVAEDPAPYGTTKD